MAKQFRWSAEARSAVMDGVNMLAKVVGITLGPSGRNVVLDKDFGPPQVCSDGVTIAKEIELKDPFENIGAQLLKVAATKTNDAVGDGTTTSTVLAQRLLQLGFKNVMAGADPMAVKRGIEKAVDAVTAELLAMARPVEGIDQIARVAILAAHDEEMGKLIGDVLDKVGSKGVVTVEESKGLGYEVEHIEGMNIDRGYISPYLVTNPDKMVAEVEEPYILLTTEKITNLNELLPMLQLLTPVSRSLVVVAEDLTGPALATLVINKLKGTLKCVAVKAPGFGDRRKSILEDMAVLFGASVISKEAGRTLESTTVADLGRCRRVIATKDDTTFVGGAGDQAAIDARIEQIRMQAEETKSDYDREKLEERGAKLSGGVSVIKVGAATEIELRERKQRLEDALSATRVAMQDGIIPGGGTSLVRACRAVLDRVEALGDERTGVRILAEAAEAPLKLIAVNAGFSGDVIFDDVMKGAGDWGFDAEADRFGSMFEMGIVDPAKVAKVALENAASVAGMILTTESLITELKPKKLPAPYND